VPASLLAGVRARGFVQADSTGLVKATLRAEAPLPGRPDDTLTLTAQAAGSRGSGGGGEKAAAALQLNGGVTAAWRGPDFTAVARLTDGATAGFSYLQRLAPGSPVTLGGEVRQRCSAAPRAGAASDAAHRSTPAAA
jgi:hypothetical protein